MKSRIVFVLIFLFSLGVVVARTAYLHGHPPTPEQVRREVPLMDRHTLSDALVSIFGEASLPVVERDIFDIGAPIGGGCDFYEMTYDDDQRLAQPLTRCPGLVKDINLPMFVKDNALRAAAVERVCRELSGDAVMVGHALRISHLTARDPVNLDNLAKLHFTFHKVPMDDREVAEYRQWLARPAPSATWALAAYSVCVSPSWQTL